MSGPQNDKGSTTLKWLGGLVAAGAAVLSGTSLFPSRGTREGAAARADSEEVQGNRSLERLDLPSISSGSVNNERSVVESLDGELMRSRSALLEFFGAVENSSSSLGNQATKAFAGLAESKHREQYITAHWEGYLRIIANSEDPSGLGATDQKSWQQISEFFIFGLGNTAQLSTIRQLSQDPVLSVTEALDKYPELASQWAPTGYRKLKAEYQQTSEGSGERRKIYESLDEMTRQLPEALRVELKQGFNSAGTSPRVELDPLRYPELFVLAAFIRFGPSQNYSAVANLLDAYRVDFEASAQLSDGDPGANTPSIAPIGYAYLSLFKAGIATPAVLEGFSRFVSSPALYTCLGAKQQSWEQAAEGTAPWSDGARYWLYSLALPQGYFGEKAPELQRLISKLLPSSQPGSPTYFERTAERGEVVSGSADFYLAPQDFSSIVESIVKTELSGAKAGSQLSQRLIHEALSSLGLAASDDRTSGKPADFKVMGFRDMLGDDTEAARPALLTRAEMLRFIGRNEYLIAELNKQPLCLLLEAAMSADASEGVSALLSDPQLESTRKLIAYSYLIRWDKLSLEDLNSLAASSDEKLAMLGTLGLGKRIVPYDSENSVPLSESFLLQESAQAVKYLEQTASSTENDKVRAIALTQIYQADHSDSRNRYLQGFALAQETNRKLSTLVAAQGMLYRGVNDLELDYLSEHASSEAVKLLFRFEQWQRIRRIRDRAILITPRDEAARADMTQALSRCDQFLSTIPEHYRGTAGNMPSMIVKGALPDEMAALRELRQEIWDFSGMHPIARGGTTIRDDWSARFCRFSFDPTP